ncbi:Protein arg-6, mitochondrial [Hypoxylon texense]
MEEYSDHHEFLSSWNVFSAARELARDIPMDFEFFHIFLMAPGDMITLLKQPPNIALYGAILGLVDPRDIIKLFYTPEIVTAFQTYLREYLHEDCNPAPPHPATLYDKLQLLLTQPEERQEVFVRCALARSPNESIYRSVEFAYRMRTYLLSPECKRDFPTIIDIRSLNLVGLAFLVVMLLTMVQQADIGAYMFDDDTWDEEACYKWEHNRIMGNQEELFRGRPRNRF